MSLDGDQPVLRAKQARREPRRTRIAALPLCLYAIQISPQAIRQIGARTKITQLCDSRVRFAGTPSLLAFEIVQSTARMAVDDTEGFFLASQVQKHREHRNMLYDIGKIAGMEDVAVIHACASQENVVCPTVSCPDASFCAMIAHWQEF
jgi:hypothetical protein